MCGLDLRRCVYIHMRLYLYLYLLALFCLPVDCFLLHDRTAVPPLPLHIPHPARWPLLVLTVLLVVQSVILEHHQLVHHSPFAHRCAPSATLHRCAPLATLHRPAPSAALHARGRGGARERARGMQRTCMILVKLPDLPSPDLSSSDLSSALAFSLCSSSPLCSS